MSGKKGGLVRHLRRCECGAVLVNSEIPAHRCGHQREAVPSAGKALQASQAARQNTVSLHSKTRPHVPPRQASSVEGECPVCRRLFPSKAIGKHIQECLAREDRIGHRMEQSPGPVSARSGAPHGATKPTSTTRVGKVRGVISSKLPDYSARSDAGLTVAGLRAPLAKGEKPKRPEDIERRLDGSRGTGYQGRDRGRYGSHALHDDYNEDSEP